jgi:hypothetical protein
MTPGSHTIRRRKSALRYFYQMFVPEAAEAEFVDCEDYGARGLALSVPRCIRPTPFDDIRVIELAGYRRFGLAGTDKMGMEGNGAVAKE